MKDKNIPKKDSFDHLLMTNAASATECTGLITHLPTEDELEAYMDVYTYQAIPVKDEKEKDKNRY